jgi:hypothetical protein
MLDGMRRPTPAREQLAHALAHRQVAMHVFRSTMR